MSDVAAAIRVKLDARSGGWGTFVHCDCGECKALNAALLAVLELHQPNGTRLPECSECHQVANEYEPGPDIASPVDWPCPTVRTIARALGVDDA